MLKNRQITDRIKNQLRLINKDSDLNDRFILQTAQDIAESYLSKKARDRSLYRYADLYQTIECVELEKVDTYSCDIVAFKSCNKLMRSKKKLPELIYSRYGPSIKEVTAIDNDFDFKLSTVSQYRRDKKRRTFSKNLKYFFVRDDYLWIPECDVEVVNLYVLFRDRYEANQFCSCSDDCRSAWDFDFVITSDMLEQVIRETVQQVSVTLQIPEDEKPNLDSNQKTQTV